MKTYSVFKQSKDDFRIVASIDYKSYIVRWSVMPPNTDIISFKTQFEAQVCKCLIEKGEWEVNDYGYVKLPVEWAGRILAETKSGSIDLTSRLTPAISRVREVMRAFTEYAKLIPEDISSNRGPVVKKDQLLVYVDSFHESRCEYNVDRYLSQGYVIKQISSAGQRCYILFER